MPWIVINSSRAKRVQTTQMGAAASHRNSGAQRATVGVDFGNPFEPLAQNAVYASRNGSRQGSVPFPVARAPRARSRPSIYVERGNSECEWRKLLVPPPNGGCRFRCPLFEQVPPPRRENSIPKDNSDDLHFRPGPPLICRTSFRSEIMRKIKRCADCPRLRLYF